MAIDVVNNRVSATVASTNVGAEAKVTQALSRRQIPLAAIEIARGAAPRSTVARAPSVARLPFATPTLSTLQDSEPAALMGGIMIRVPNKDGSGYGSFCSIGAVVDSAGTNKLLSASHCSFTMWLLQGDSVKTFDTSLIGHETTDKTAGTGYDIGHGHYAHRGSDAALWSMDATYGAAHATLGVIARTTSRDSSGLSDTMNRTIDSSSPYLYIYDTLASSSLVVGEEVDKVGSRSGWQHGRLANTCVDIWDGGYDYECFSEVGSLSITGDSGGPVFIWDGEDGAQLIGIQEGVDKTYSHTDSSGLVSYFSNWSAIVTENGPIDPRRHTTVGAPSPSGSVSGGQAVATWSAVSTTNTTATTQYQIYESTWDASTQSWTEVDQYIGATTSLTYSDASAPWSIYAATGDGPAQQCRYSSVSIQIFAYNGGVTNPGTTTWFQGPANGSPDCRDFSFRAPRRAPGG